MMLQTKFLLSKPPMPQWVDLRHHLAQAEQRTLRASTLYDRYRALLIQATIEGMIKVREELT